MECLLRSKSFDAPNFGFWPSRDRRPASATHRKLTTRSGNVFRFT